MRVRTFQGVGLAVAALALSALTTGTATGATTSSPTSASGVTASVAASAGVSGSAATATAPDAKSKTVCSTKFGTPVDDGIISVSGSLESAGAADFTCGKKKREFGTVTVQGYNGDPGSTTFQVNVMKNCGGEPCDGGKLVCSTTGPGTPTGSGYPVADTTKITLDKSCKANKGSNWISVQAVTGSSYYWRTQSDVGGQYVADWKEAGAFGTGCTTYENGLTMQDCIFGGDQGENDFMFELSK